MKGTNILLSLEDIWELAVSRRMLNTATVREVRHVLLMFLCLAVIIFTKDRLHELFTTRLLPLTQKVCFPFVPTWIFRPTGMLAEVVEKVCFHPVFYIQIWLLGVLGGLTCVLCAYLGAEAAKVLLVFPANNQRIFRWLTWSLVTVRNKEKIKFYFEVLDKYQIFRFKIHAFLKI